MKTKKRGLLATVGAFASAAATLALGGTVVANADPVNQMPDKSAVVITKYDSAPGDAADGLPQTVTGSTIEDVTFEAYEVPVKGGTPIADLTPGTNAWQEAVAAMTPATAAAAIGDAPWTPARTGTTDANGVIVWADTAVAGITSDLQGDSLPRGLYLVRETGAPAGVVPSNDFLLAVPLTNPTDRNAWLDTIYVYPKNRTVEGTKTVDNATDYAVGDTVTWTIDLDNPSPRDNATGEYIAADKFLVLDTIKDEYLTSTADGVKVTVPTGLTKDGATPDYTVELVAGTADNNIAVGSTQIQVEFTAAGRAKLAEAMKAAEATTKVTITIDTVVNKVGVIENSAQFYSSEAQTDPKEIPGTSVKYGNTVLTKKSTDTDLTGAALAGAEFKVYLTEAAAKAGGTDNVVPTFPSGTSTTGYSNGVWTTQSGGTVTIDGLRYSNFADGVDQTKYSGEGCEDTTSGGANCTLNAKYQTYWLVETKALDGHQLLAEPIPFEITMSDSSTGFDVTNTKTTGGFTLPLTGGTGTLLLTVGGIALLATVLVVARRRRSAEAAE